MASNVGVQSFVLVSIHHPERRCCAKPAGDYSSNLRHSKALTHGDYLESRSGVSVHRIVRRKIPTTELSKRTEFRIRNYRANLRWPIAAANGLCKHEFLHLLPSVVAWDGGLWGELPAVDFQSSSDEYLLHIHWVEHDV